MPQTAELEVITSTTIALHEGLDGLDDSFGVLQALFETLQLSAVEAADYEDVLTFATSVTYFAQVEKHTTTIVISAEGIEEDETPTPRAITPKTPKKPNKRSRKRAKQQKRTELMDEARLHAALANFLDSPTTPSDLGTLSASSSSSSSGITSHSTTLAPEFRDSIPSTPIDLRADSGGDVMWDLALENPNDLHLHVSTSSPSPQMEREKHREPKTNSTPRPVTTRTFIGFVYLIQLPSAAGVGLFDVGIVIDREHRGWGYATQATKDVLKYAFEDLGCHRVQARVPDGPYRSDALKLFTKLKFTHEGTRRRAFFTPCLQEWKDATYCALLDTDWIIWDSMKVAPPTLWDEMFIRHEQERVALLHWQKQK